VSEIARRDSRTLFEQAWAHGVGSGIISTEQRDSIISEGTKAIRKIASILGSENLRADLERAMLSMLGLVNLHLQKVSRGDVRVASRMLAEYGLLHHTRGASQSIKRILALREGCDPQQLDAEQKQRFEVEVVSSWARYSFEEFRIQEAEANLAHARRTAAAALSSALGPGGPDDYHEPEQVIMTALLIMAYHRKKAWLRSQQEFEKLLEAIRKSPARLSRLPKGLPAGHEEVITRVWAEHSEQLAALILDEGTPLHVLAAGDPSINRLHDLMVLPEDALGEVDDHESQTTAHWKKLTRGTSDEAKLLAIMLQGVLGLTEKTPWSVKTAMHLLETDLLTRPPSHLIRNWLHANAPHQNQSDLLELWNDFWDEREDGLHDDASAEDYRTFCTNWLPMRAPRSS